MDKSREALLAEMGVNADADAVPGWMDRRAKEMLLRLVKDISAGTVTVRDGDGETVCRGAADPDFANAAITVRHPSFYRRILFGGTIGAGEAYMDGLWTCDDLTALVRIVVRNRQFFTGLDSGLGRLLWPLHQVSHLFRRNSREGSRRNIAAHYDLGNDFFALFLDPTMAYSCGYFDTPESTMEEASVSKMDRLCRMLRLVPGDSLLEIGTGWGALAIHAARNFGCRVTTTTISREQHDLATERVREAGLADRITLLLKDYRDLEGRFDKIISVEMLEAVGHQFYDAFFKKCAGLLNPGGLMALQTITVNDQDYESTTRDVDFIKRYIFPGGQLPSLTAICQSLTRATDLRVFHLEEISAHYVTTLLRWRDNFWANVAEIRGLGYSETFLRMWDFYLCLCAGSFAERHTGDVQMLLAKPGWRPEPTA